MPPQIMVFTSTNNLKGGASNSLYTYLEHTEIKTDQIEVCVESDGSLREELEKKGFKTFSLDRTNYGALRNYIKNPVKLLGEVMERIQVAWGTFRQIRTRSPDIAYTNNIRSGTQALIAWIMGLTVVRRVRGLETISLLRRLLTWVRINLTVLISDKILPVSEGNKRIIESYALLRHDDIRTIPNGIAPKVLNVDENNVSQIKSDHNLQDQSVVGCVSSVNRRKNTLDFVEIARRVTDDHPDVTFIQVGHFPENDYSERVKQKAKELSNPDRLIFTGWQPNPEDYLQTMSVFLFPTKSEGFPRSTLEAMYFEKPVVATNVSGIEDQIDNEQNGFLFEPGDVSGAVKNVKRLLKDSDLRAQIGRKGRETVLKHYTAEAIARKMDGVFRKNG